MLNFTFSNFQSHTDFNIFTISLFQRLPVCSEELFPDPVCVSVLGFFQSFWVERHFVTVPNGNFFFLVSPRSRSRDRSYSPRRYSDRSRSRSRSRRYVCPTCLCVCLLCASLADADFEVSETVLEHVVLAYTNPPCCLDTHMQSVSTSAVVDPLLSFCLYLTALKLPPLVLYTPSNGGLCQSGT